MGRYITWDDVIDRYRVLSKDSKDGSSEVESAFIFYAEHELDALMAPAFTVPFSSNNMTAKDLAIDLTYCRAGNFKISEQKEFKQSIMDRIDMLKKGEMSMLTDSGDTIDTSGSTSAWSTTKDYHPVFGHGPTEHFEVDSSQVVAEDNERGYFY